MQPQGVAVGDGYAYIAGYNDWIIVDIDPPEEAHIVTTVHYGVQGIKGDIVAANGMVYLYGQSKIMAYDVSNPGNPEFKGSISFWGPTHPFDHMLARNGFLYVNGILIIDATDPTDMFVSATSVNDFSKGSMHLMGGFLFTAAADEGVGIFDIFPPGTIEPVYNMPVSDDESAYYIACRSGYMFVSTCEVYRNGLRIYKWW